MSPVPKIVVDYGYKLLNTTNGHWKPEVRNCHLVISDTIICQFEIRRKKRPEVFVDRQLELLALNEDYIIAVHWHKKNACPVILEYQR